ncbi:hypothetical protein [Kaarinaea lacus]
MNTIAIGQRKSIDEIMQFSKTNTEQLKVLVMSESLPAEIRSYVNEYNGLAWKRDEFLWKWVWSLVNARNPGFTLSTVSERHFNEVAALKFLWVMAVTIIDDVCCRLKDFELAKVLLEVPFRPNVETPIQFPYEKLYAVDLLSKIIKLCQYKMQTASRYGEFQLLFDYDIKQEWNALEFANLLHHCPQISNAREYNLYGSHNMMFYVFADIDLMYSRGFDMRELPALREVLWHAQQMTRIGNWVTTWEREIEEANLSSGVVGMAIAKGVVHAEEILHNLNKNEIKDIITRIKNHRIEESLFLDWERNRTKIISLSNKIKSVNINEYLDGLELVMVHHLSCRGLI